MRATLVQALEANEKTPVAATLLHWYFLLAEVLPAQSAWLDTPAPWGNIMQRHPMQDHQMGTG